MMPVQWLLTGLTVVFRSGKTIVVGGLLLAVLAVFSMLLLERNAARREVMAQSRTLAQQQEQIALLQDSVTKQLQSIRRQNQAVNALKAASDAQIQAGASALARAQQTGQALAVQIQHLNDKNRAADVVTKRSCEDALREWRAGR